MLVAAVIILAGVVVVASGRGGEMAPEYPDYPPIDLGPVTAADVVMMRPPSAAWGYNMRVTDEALEAIARAVTERDVRISALEQEVSDLRGQAGGHPLGAEPAIQDPAPGPVSPYEAAAHGLPPHETASYADATHEESPYPDAAQDEPAYPDAARDEPAYPDADQDEPAHPEADQDPALGTSQHVTWEASAQPSVWESARPYEQAHGDDVDDHDSGPVTDPDLPRVPADAADLSQPPSFWDPAAPPSAAPQAVARVPGDEPDGRWDERPHQTLVWGAAHQRAKATRIQEQDEADQDAARRDEENQDGPGPADYDGPGSADYEEARQPAGSEQDRE